MGQHRRRRRRRRRRTKSLKERGGRCGDDAAMLARSKKSIGGNKDGEGNSPAGTSRPGGECAVFRCKCTRRTALMRLMRGGARGGARGCRAPPPGSRGVRRSSRPPPPTAWMRRICIPTRLQTLVGLPVSNPFTSYVRMYIHTCKSAPTRGVHLHPTSHLASRQGCFRQRIHIISSPLVVRASTFAAAPRLRVLSLSPVLFAARG